MIPRIGRRKKHKTVAAGRGGGGGEGHHLTIVVKDNVHNKCEALKFTIYYLFVFFQTYYSSD